MCLIIVKPENVALPKSKYLSNAQDRNSDGIGAMFWKSGGNKVEIKKDFKGLREFKRWLKETITPEDVLVIHFRFATSGNVDVGNRHPFPVTHNKKRLRTPELNCSLAMVHNGVLSKYSGHKKYSDTQKFILDILAEPRVKESIMESRTMQRLVRSYIDGDRLALLNESGAYLLLGEYIKEDGIYYSNDGFRTPYRYASYYKYLKEPLKPLKKGKKNKKKNRYNADEVLIDSGYLDCYGNIDEDGNIQYEQCDYCCEYDNLHDVTFQDLGLSLRLCTECAILAEDGELMI